MTVIPFPLPKNSAAPPTIATDAEATLIFSMVLDREAEFQQTILTPATCWSSRPSWPRAPAWPRTPTSPYSKM
jgi:hypothetical protein